MWNTTDYKGNPVTWYSQDEMNWVMNKLDDANKCLEDCELHWERERKILKESLNKAHDANKSLGYTYLRYKQALEKIRDITEKLITELPEYHSCYYKDECGDNCTPKKQNKVEYCCYENVDKILTIINEV